MRNRKRVLILAEIIMALIVLFFTFAFLREQNGSVKPRVSVIVDNADANCWAAFLYGIKTAAAEQDVEYFAVSAGTSVTFDELLALMEEETKNGASALIVQPTADMDADVVAERIGSVPLVFPEQTDAGVSVAPDNYAMGQALGEQILADYRDNLSGKQIGIVQQQDDTEAAKLREQGLRDALRGSKAAISWSYVGDTAETELSDCSRVDIVAALDDAGTVLTAETAAAGNLRGAVVYGIGTSTDAIYYLDTGEIKCLVVPDEFERGYRSVTEIAGELTQLFYQAQGATIGYTALRRDMLFGETGQQILYTMSQ